MKKIVVCDDVELERQMLKDLLLLHFQEKGERVAVLEYESGENLIADVEEEYLRADLLFLDIHMRGMNGLDVARELRKIGWMGAIVFLTASPDYAVESYEVQAAGYILKPYDIEKIKILTDQILEKQKKKRISVKSQRQKRSPGIDDIMYMESDRHVVTIHMRDGSSILTQEKMRDLKSRIGQKRFLHCHQSYLVNMDYIRDVEEEFVLADNSRIPIRVRGRKQVLEEYDQYFHEDCAQKRAENAREKKKEKRML